MNIKKPAFAGFFMFIFLSNISSKYQNMTLKHQLDF